MKPECFDCWNKHSDALLEMDTINVKSKSDDHDDCRIASQTTETTDVEELQKTIRRLKYENILLNKEVKKLRKSRDDYKKYADHFFNKHC